MTLLISVSSCSTSFCINTYKVSVILMDNLLSQILRVLLTILDTSSDPRALAVACFDLSQFIQYHPAGRVIVTDLKAKERVMKLMNHENTEVTKSALLCIQRLFLGAKYASFLQAWILFLWGPVLFTKEMLVMIWFQFGWLGCLFTYQSLEEFMNQGNSSVGFF